MNIEKIIYFLILFTLLSFNINAKQISVTTVAQITTAMTTAKPGDTLVMSTTGSWSNVVIDFEGSGTAARPIVLKAQTSAGVVVSGQSNLLIGGNYLIVSGLIFENGYSPTADVVQFRKLDQTPSTYCELTNTSIIDYNIADSTVDNKWVSLYGSYNRVDHCYLKGKTNVGTTLVVWLSDTPNYHRIDHNYFGYRPELYTNGGEAIRVGTGDWAAYDSYTTVEYNYFEQCDGDPEVISNKSCHNTYRYNTLYECEGSLSIRQGNFCTVNGNFLIQQDISNSGGIRVCGQDHLVYNNYIQNSAGNGNRSAISLLEGTTDTTTYPQVQRASIVFNTLVNCKYSLTVGAGYGGTAIVPPINCVFANNLVYGTTSPLIIYMDTPTNMTYQSNIFFGATLGITTPAGISMVDPLLTQSSSGLWRPDTSLSPIKNAATGTYSYVTIDMDGQSRTGVYDIGADEISSGTILLRPLTANDVGPYTSGIALPVELVSFNANVASDDNVILSWVTASEINCSKFLIMKDFRTIGSVNSLGSSVKGNTYSITDKFVTCGKHIYSISEVDNNGTVKMMSEKEIIVERPDNFSLNQNYPNPFNPSTVIEYSLPRAGNVELTIYNSIGQIVSRLAHGYQEAGNYSAKFDGLNCSSGVYFYQLKTAEYTNIKKMILIK